MYLLLFCSEPQQVVVESTVPSRPLSRIRKFRRPCLSLSFAYLIKWTIFTLDISSCAYVSWTSPNKYYGMWRILNLNPLFVLAFFSNPCQHLYYPRYDCPYHFLLSISCLVRKGLFDRLLTVHKTGIFCFLCPDPVQICIGCFMVIRWWNVYSPYKQKKCPHFTS